MKRKIFALLIAVMLMLPAFSYATTFSATRAASGFPVAGVGDAGSCKVAYGFVRSPFLRSGDIFEFCKIPRDATVVGGRLYASDLDTGAETLEIDIGYATSATDTTWDTDAFLNSGVLTGDAVTGVKPETGTSMPFGGVILVNGPKKFLSETKVIGRVTEAPATTATGWIGVEVFYSMD